MAATQPVRRFPWGQFGRRMLCTFFGGATVGLSYTMYNMIGEMNELYPALHVRTALLVRAREELINSRSEQEKILLDYQKFLTENGQKNEQTTKKIDSLSKQLENLKTNDKTNDILSKLLHFNPPKPVDLTK